MSNETCAPQVFCGICGWPTGGHPCAACGAAPGARADGVDVPNLRAFLGPEADDYPELKPLFMTWQQGDGPRYIRQCLQVLGVENPGYMQRDGSDWWIFVESSAVVLAGLDRMSKEVSLESPILQLARQRRVPLMRALLQLNGYRLQDARFCLRGDIVVLVFTEALANLPPPRLIEVIREHALTADRFDDPLSLAFSARLLGPEILQADDPLSYRGVPIRLQTLRGTQQPAAPVAGVAAPVPAAPDTGPHRGVAERHAGVSMPGLMAFKGVVQLIRQWEETLRLIRLHRATRRNEKTMGIYQGSELYVNRALVYLAQERCGAEVPGMVVPMARAAAPYLYQLPPLGSDQSARHQPFLKACQQIANQQADHSGQQPVKLRPFSSAAEAGAHLSQLLTVIDALDLPTARHLLLCGAIAEIVLRIRLAPADTQRLSEMLLKAGDGQADAARIVALLRQELATMIARMTSS